MTLSLFLRVFWMPHPSQGTAVAATHLFDQPPSPLGDPYGPVPLAAHLHPHIRAQEMPQHIDTYTPILSRHSFGPLGNATRCARCPVGGAPFLLVSTRLDIPTNHPQPRSVQTTNRHVCPACGHVGTTGLRGGLTAHAALATWERTRTAVHARYGAHAYSGDNCPATSTPGLDRALP